MTQPRLGFIGIGLMGDPMTRRLLQAGFEVCVWNRTPAKAEALHAVGARVADSISELVAGVDVLMLCLANTEVVEAVVFGEDGVAAHGRPDQRLIDFSSSDPQATQRFAARLERDCGMRWIDCPVSGGVAGAEAGSLVMMAGDFANPAWHLRTLLKDLDMAVAQSQRSGSATPMSGLAAQLMRSHANQGFAEHDPATLVNVYRQKTGKT